MLKIQLSSFKRRMRNIVRIVYGIFDWHHGLFVCVGCGRYYVGMRCGRCSLNMLKAEIDTAVPARIYLTMDGMQGTQNLYILRMIGAICTLYVDGLFNIRCRRACSIQPDTFSQDDVKRTQTLGCFWYDGKNELLITLELSNDSPWNRDIQFVEITGATCPIPPKNNSLCVEASTFWAPKKIEPSCACVHDVSAWKKIVPQML